LKRRLGDPQDSTTYKHKKISMPQAGFETTITAIEKPIPTL
jgi:hypothetical protein